MRGGYNATFFNFLRVRLLLYSKRPQKPFLSHRISVDLAPQLDMRLLLLKQLCVQ